MSERSFYKVRLGSASTGGKFIWTNNGRAIECDLKCSLIPVTKAAAFALPDPPGYTAGTFHQKFEPSISGTPSVEAISGTSFNKYDYSGCGLGGDEFLLTDHTLGKYCVTLECAMIILSRMFFIDHDFDEDVHYLGNGEDFKYGCDPYVECMYGNGVIYGIEPDEETGVVSFRLHVFGVTDPGDVGTIDFRYAYCLMEKDIVPGGFYSGSSKGHIYSYYLQYFDIDILEKVVEDPTLLNAVDDPEPELVTIPAENWDASLNYSFGKRENIIHAAGSADPIYGEVFSSSVTDGTWSNSAYEILDSVSARAVTPLQVGPKMDMTLFSPPNRASVSSGASVNRFPVYAWETITGKASSFTSDDDYNKVILTFSAVVGNGYIMRLTRDGKLLRDFLPGTYTNEEFVDWTMGRGNTYHYSLVYYKIDQFGYNYGEEVTCTGSDLAYSDSDIPAIDGFTYDNQFYTGVKYMWDVPTPGAGLVVDGYVYAVKMTPENGYGRFSDVIQEVDVANGVASLFRVVGSKGLTENRCLFVKYRNTSNNKVIYSEASELLPDVRPALTLPSRLIYMFSVGKETGRFLLKWKANYPSETIFKIYYNDALIDTVSGTDEEFVYGIPFSNQHTKTYDNNIRVCAIFEINEYGDTRQVVDNVSRMVYKKTPPPEPKPAPKPDPTPFVPVIHKEITPTKDSNPPAEKAKNETIKHEKTLV